MKQPGAALVGALTLFGLALGACSVEKQQARFPVTTTSKTAREAYQKGRDLLDAGKPAEARPLFAQAVEQDPNFALAWLGTAEAAPSARARANAVARAAALADRLSEGERRWIQGYEAGIKGNLEAQFEHYSTIVRLYPEDERAPALLAGHLLATRQYAPAVGSLTRATQIAPDYALAYLLLARAQAASGNSGEAQVAVGEYVKRWPAEPIGYALRGETLMKNGDFEGSVRAYEEALSHDPHFAEGYVGLGVAQVFLGHGDLAQAAFDKLAQSARDDTDRRLALEWTALGHVFEGHAELALDPLRRRLALAEQAGDAASAAEDHTLLGDVLLEVQRADDAMAEYHAAADSIGRSDLPDSIKEALLARQPYYEARVALARGDLTQAEAKAMEYRERAARAGIATDGSRQQELIGEIKLQSGETGAALRMLQRLVRGDSRTQWLLASALHRAGDPVRALGPCRQAAQFNAADPAYAFVRQKALALLPELEREAAEHPRRPGAAPRAGGELREAEARQRPAPANSQDRAARLAAAKERQAAARRAEQPGQRPPAGR